MNRKTDFFPAVDDAGRRYTIEVWTEFLRSENFEGSGEVEGMKQLRTSDGRSLNRLDKGEYVIRLTGERLHSTAPNAL
jgi:hypothetical protein